MPRNRLPRLAVVALGVSLTAAACGGSDDNPTPPSNATTLTATATTGAAGTTSTGQATTAAAATAALRPAGTVETVQFAEGSSLRTLPLAEAMSEAAQRVGFDVVQPTAFVTAANTLVGVQVAVSSGQSSVPLKQALLTYSKDGGPPDPGKGEPYLRVIEADQVPNSDAGELVPGAPAGVQVVKETTPKKVTYLFQLEDRGVIFEFGGELPRDDRAVIAMYQSLK